MKSNIADFAVSFDASICLTVKRIQIHRATSQKEKVWKYIRRWLCEVLRQIKTQQQQINCFRGWEKGGGEGGRKESWKEKKTGYLKQCQWFDFNFEFTIVLSCSDNQNGCMHWSGPFLDYFDHIKRKSCLKNNTFKLQSKGIFSLLNYDLWHKHFLLQEKMKWKCWFTSPWWFL